MAVAHFCETGTRQKLKTVRKNWVDIGASASHKPLKRSLYRNLVHFNVFFIDVRQFVVCVQQVVEGFFGLRVHFFCRRQPFFVMGIELLKGRTPETLVKTYRSMRSYRYPPRSVSRLASIDVVVTGSEFSRAVSVLFADDVAADGGASVSGKALARRIAPSHHLAHSLHSSPP